MRWDIRSSYHRVYRKVIDEAGLCMLKRNVRNLKGEKSLVSLYINRKQQQTKVKDKKIRKIISTSMMS